MMKAICFKDVLPGDVVCKEVGRTRQVGAVSAERDPYVELFFREGGFTKGRPEELIGLVHRPWPEGKTKEQMLAELRLAAAFFAEKGMGWVPLREALEAYELGKPLAEVPTPQPEVKQPEGSEGYGVRGVGTVWTPR